MTTLFSLCKLILAATLGLATFFHQAPTSLASRFQEDKCDDPEYRRKATVISLMASGKYKGVELSTEEAHTWITLDKTILYESGELFKAQQMLKEFGWINANPYSPFNWDIWYFIGGWKNPCPPPPNGVTAAIGTILLIIFLLLLGRVRTRSPMENRWPSGTPATGKSI